MSTYFSKTKECCQNVIEQTLRIKNQELNEVNALNFSELSSIYAINNSLIQTINSVREEIIDGKINNWRTYSESDLGTVEVILAIYFEYGEDQPIAISTNAELLWSKILKQIAFFQNALDYFPEDMGINIKRKPRVISTINLDYYQLIYLSLSHMIGKIQSAILQRNIQELAQKKKVYF